MRRRVAAGDGCDAAQFALLVFAGAVAVFAALVFGLAGGTAAVVGTGIAARTSMARARKTPYGSAVRALYSSSVSRRAPFETGKRKHPVFAQRIERFDDRLVLAGLAHRRLKRTLQRVAVLFDAVLGLGAVDAFVGLRIAELDDLDALDVAAHRVEVIDRVEVAIDRIARRVRAEIGFGLGCGLRLLRRRGGDGKGECGGERGRRDERGCESWCADGGVDAGCYRAPRVRGKPNGRTSATRSRRLGVPARRVAVKALRRPKLRSPRR